MREVLQFAGLAKIHAKMVQTANHKLGFASRPNRIGSLGFLSQTKPQVPNCGVRFFGLEQIMNTPKYNPIKPEKF